MSSCNNTQSSQKRDAVHHVTLTSLTSLLSLVGNEWNKNKMTHKNLKKISRFHTILNLSAAPPACHSQTVVVYDPHNLFALTSAPLFNRSSTMGICSQRWASCSAGSLQSSLSLVVKWNWTIKCSMTSMFSLCCLVQWDFFCLHPIDRNDMQNSFLIDTSLRFLFCWRCGFICFSWALRGLSFCSRTVSRALRLFDEFF